MVLLNGTHFCGSNAICTEGTDNTYGFTCACESGYTEQRINFGNY